MTDTLKLSQLVAGDSYNPRTAEADLAQLVASIKAFGLIQPLVVRQIFAGGEQKTVGAKYEVIAGNRRLAALHKIHPKSKDVDVRVVVRQLSERQGATAKEIALAENTVRANLHPVDEYQAYASLIAEGLTVDGIAKRFGIKSKWIHQRLQLARLAPELREAWLKGKMGQEQAEALSSSPDQNKQVEVWRAATGKNSGGEYQQRPDSLRREMRARSVPLDDPRVKLVGLDAYLACGGTTHEDLFSAASALDDEELINRLAAERLEAEAQLHRTQGWGWVECRVTSNGQWHRELEFEAWLTDEERAIAESDDWKRREKVLTEARERAEADPAARAKSGVVLRIDKDGTIDAHTLVVRDEEAEAQEEARRERLRARMSAAPSAESEEPVEDAPSAPRINYALRESLSEQMTVALSKAVAETSGIVLPVLYATLRCALWPFHAGPAPFRLDVRDHWQALAPKFGEQDSPDWASEFKGACEVPFNTLLIELALLLAALVDARVIRYDHRGDMSVKMPPLVEALASELPTFAARIAEAFDADAYFERVTAAQCAAALLQMDGREPAPKKKAELAAQAAKRAKEVGWLPPELRTASYEGPGTMAWEAARKAAQ